MNNIVNYLKKNGFHSPKVCLSLGSGWDAFTNLLKNKMIIGYNEIPGFYNTSVKGHKGEFIFGYVNKAPIICASGRFHYYEEYSFKEVGSIIDIFKLFNPKLSIITNSSGCLNLDWEIGSFMLINNFMDFSFRDSLDVTYYKISNTKYFNKVLSLANNLNIKLNTGTYTYTSGPSYETPAEIKEIKTLGGDAVGMSTLPEFLRCNQLKMKSIFLSCLTNYGAGIIPETRISHLDVLENANKSKKNINSILKNIIQNI